MPNDPFYTSSKWRNDVRPKALRRDKYLCQECKRYGKNIDATVVDHILPRDQHPELQYTMSNLRSLCDACHNKKHPEKGRRKGIPPTSAFRR